MLCSRGKEVTEEILNFAITLLALAFLKWCSDLHLHLQGVSQGLCEEGAVVVVVMGDRGQGVGVLRPN